MWPSSVSRANTPRFGLEALAIAEVNHSHIGQIYDIGPDYLVLEYIEGKPEKRL